MLLLPLSFRVCPLAKQHRNMCPIKGGREGGGAHCEARIKV